MNRRILILNIAVLGFLLLGSSISTASSFFADAYGVEEINIKNFEINLGKEPCVDDELSFTIKLDFYQFALSEANKGTIKSMDLDIKVNGASVEGYPITVTKDDDNTIEFSTSFSSPGIKRITACVDEDTIVWEDEPVVKNKDLSQSIGFWVSDPTNKITKVHTESFPIIIRLKTIFQQFFPNLCSF